MKKPSLARVARSQVRIAHEFEQLRAAGTKGNAALAGTDRAEPKNSPVEGGDRIQIAHPEPNRPDPHRRGIHVEDIVPGGHCGAPVEKMRPR